MKIKRMQAAIVVRQHQPLVVAEIELPPQLEYGQVLVRIEYSGICGSQIGEIDGVKGPDAHLPHLLGHEGSGRVIELGPQVTKVTAGDHVVLHWKSGAGISADVPKYRWKGGVVNAGAVTTFNEYAIVSENRLTKIPQSYPLREACLYGCALTTAIGVIENKGNLRLGESVIIVGAGGVGLGMIMGAKLRGASTIIAVDKFEEKLTRAMRVGATHCLNTSAGDWVGEVGRLIGDGADLVIDNTGQSSVIESCITLTKPTGRTILVGVPALEDKVEFHSLQLHFGKLLTGTHGGDGCPSEDIPRYMSAVDAGILQLEGMLDHEYRLSDINTAINDLRDGRIAGRCIIRFSDNLL